MAFALQLPDCINRIYNAVPLIIDELFIPNSESETLPIAATLYLRKLLGERKLSPIKIILGWELNTDMIVDKLEKDGFVRWTRDIKYLIEIYKNRIKVTGKEL